MKKKRGKKPAAAKRAPKNPDVGAPKRRRFVEGLIVGKSMRRAALDAGYTQAMADNAGNEIMPRVRKEFQEQLRRKVPHAKLIQRIAEGLNAKETRLAQFEGDYTDQRHLVNYSERRRYAELALKILGFLVEKVEVGGSEEGPVNLNITVKFVKADQDPVCHNSSGPLVPAEQVGEGDNASLGPASKNAPSVP